MNKSYRSVFNESTSTWTAVQENATAKGRGTSVKLDNPVKARGGLTRALTRAFVLVAGCVGLTVPLIASASDICVTDASGSYDYSSKGQASTSNCPWPASTFTGINSADNVILGDSGTAAMAISNNQFQFYVKNASTGTGSYLTFQDIGAGGVTINGLAPGALSASSQQAVNGAQLYATNANVTNLTNTVNTISNGGGIKYLHTNSTLADSSATGTNATAIGPAAVASATDSNAFGNAASAAASSTTAVGAYSRALTANTVALGNGAYAYSAGTTSSGSSTAVGTSSTASGSWSTAMGTLARSSADASTAIGVNATSSGDRSIAIGASATSGGSYSFALGTLALSSGTNSSAIGVQATASASSSVAIGYKSVGDRANAVSVGSASSQRQVIYVAAGGVSATSTDAVNGSQLYTTNAQVTTLQGQVASAVMYDSSAYSSVTLGGVGATAPVALYNVANGALSASSTDAVNGAQLFATNANVTSLSNTVNNMANGSGMKYFHTNSTLADSVVSGTNSTAIGPMATAAATQTIAIGYGATASQSNGSTASIAMGSGAAAYSNGGLGNVGGAIAIGPNAQAVMTGTGGSSAGGGDIAIGANSNATGSASWGWNTAIGFNASTTNYQGTAVGAWSQAAVQATAIGPSATASNTNASAFGQSSTAAGNASLAMGVGSKATGASSIAAGAGANSTGSSSVAVGNNAFGGNDYATGVGNSASASGDRSVAMGASAAASGGYATALGMSAKAAGSYATAVGTSANASASNAVALGNGANASVANSVALGNGATTAAAVATTGATIGGTAYTFAGTTPTGVVSVGTAAATRQIQNVAAGQVTAASTDAVNGSQLYATNTQVTNNATSITNLDGRVTQNTADISTINSNLTTINGTMADAVMYDSSAHNSVTLGGVGSTTSVVLHNVANGVLNASSTDAVNGSQLYATNSNVTNLSNTVNNITNGGGIQYFHTNSTLADSVATGTNATAIGPQATASGTNSMAMGQLAQATNLNAVSLGMTSSASGLHATAIGPGAAARGADSVAIGQVAVANGTSGVAVGLGTAASATNSAAVGANANASVANSVALGSNASTTAAVATASGVIAGTTYNYAGTTPTGVVSVGTAAATRQIQNVAAGQVTASSTDAINGSQLYATNTQVTKNATDISTINSNLTNMADGDAVNVGQMNSAIAAVSQEAANAVNPFVAADGDRATEGAVASGTHATALGANAKATAANSVALGAGSVADRENTVSVGSVGNERQITNVAAGTAGTDAVNVDQLHAATAQSQGYVDSRMAGMQSQVNDAKKDAFGAAAAAMAVAGLPQPTQPGKTMVAAGASRIGGQTGMALGISYVTESNKWVGKLAASSSSQGSTGVTVGAGYQW
jgi:autotransporter adhesin